MSRQREYQKRMRAAGRCIICGQPAVPSRSGRLSMHCDYHLADHRRRARERTRRGLRRKPQKEPSMSQATERPAAELADGAAESRGMITVRLPRRLQELAKQAALACRVSLNQFCVGAIEHAVTAPPPNLNPEP